MPKVLIFNMKKLLFVVFFFMVNAVVAQNRSYKLKADKAYDAQDYITAAYYYDKALQNGTTTTQGTVPYFSTQQNKQQHPAEVAYVVYRLAEAYRLYHNLTMAQKWYAEAVDKYSSTYPDARFWYAICLRANNKIDEAIKQLQVFAGLNKNEQYAEAAKKELLNSAFAKQQMDAPNLSKITRMGGSLGSEGGDFGLSVNNGQYWFTSTRYAADNVNHVNRIFTGEPDSTSLKKMLDLNADPKLIIHYGTPSLEASGKRMYFTVWFNNEKGETRSTIYLSKYINYKWLKPQKLNTVVNVAGYNAMQPFVTPDGKRLYFASNQPGGLGGTDIWMSDLDIEGSPLTASNLGSTVNTLYDEQAPFYDSDNHKLVYSSKGLVGMGGFDFYESTDSAAKWSAPKNLGYPFNSTKDDLYYYPDSKNDDSFFISSDRQSECCLNLFRVKAIRPKPKPKPVLAEADRTAVLSGLVIDCANNKPLPGVNINLVDAASKQSLVVTTDVTGKYEFALTIKHSYTLKLEKPDYFTKVMVVPSVSVSIKDTLFNPVICQQQYEIDKPVVIDNILYDFDKYVLKPESN
jgi:OOP family OmpA-OmpF porin